MNNIHFLRLSMQGIFYLSLQMVVTQPCIGFHQGACFIYIAFLLLLPWQQQNVPLLLVVGFGIGLFMDLCYDSGGVHAFAAVLMMYSREKLLVWIAPTCNGKEEVPIRLRTMGISKFSIFVLLLTAVHHMVLFLLGTWDIVVFLHILGKVIVSILLTYIAIISTQLVALFLHRL